MSSDYFKSLKIFIAVIIISTLFGFAGGLVTNAYFYRELGNYFPNPNTSREQEIQTEDLMKREMARQELITDVVEKVSPSVVSIIVTKDLPVFEKYYYSPFQEFFGQDFLVPQYRQKGTEEREIGGGTGFIISEDGMVLTNKHVIQDEKANYTVLTNQGKRYSAEVLATDPFQDLAVLKVKRSNSIDKKGDLETNGFKPIELGNSNNLKPGQTVIAIGNALGEFRNTVSVGVISGLGRTITASGGGIYETLENVIQTDAAINKGNSGGPLLNLRGEVIGINTAMAQSAQNIGFAIPVNAAKRDIQQVREKGEIVYPFLGIRYSMITEKMKEQFDLKADHGAWIGYNQLGQEVQEPIVSGSAADEAGLQKGDIIIEFDGEKVTNQNTLAEIIRRYMPEDKVTLKVLRNGEEKTFEVTLGEI